MAGIRKNSKKALQASDKDFYDGLNRLYGMAVDIMGIDLSVSILGPITVNKLKSRGVITEHNLESEEDHDSGIVENPVMEHAKAILGKPVFEPEPELLDREIQKSDWMPFDPDGGGISEPDADFVAWVNSFSEAGFSNAIPYKKFELYKRQAREWLQDKKTIYDCQGADEEDEYIETEVNRIDENVSYGIRKYGKLKEASVPAGFLWFGDSFYEVQDAICYIIDCGYSPLIPKCRQIGISSVFGYIIVFKTALRFNYFSKFVTYDEKKTEELFRDKIKYAYAEFPDMFRPRENPNWANNKITFSSTKEKGRAESGLRQILCETATPSAINGGSPNMVLVDEASFVKCLTEMVDEAEAAMYWTNPKTRKRELKRQIAMWGTGGKMINDTFEDMYRTNVEAWKSGNIQGAFLPLFIDFYSNPANTQELYDNLKRKAYNKKGPKAEISRIIFHAACPITLDDVFLKSSETLIDLGAINANLRRIGDFQKQFPQGMPVGGRFKPIYDYNQPNSPGSLFTHRILGVEWEEMEETISERDGDTIKVMYPPVYRMREEPEHHRWLYRYFQGTDSINSSEGHSNFSSSIWDAVLCAPIALLDFRETDFRECYRQAILMNMYYGNCPHLVEYNSGEEFINKIDSLGLGNTLIMNAELKPRYRINGAKVGISSKANSKPFIVDSMKVMFMDYGNRFFFRTPFEQLKHFTSRKNKNGGTTWATSDTSRFRDDTLFSLTYSNIASDCYATMGLLPFDTQQAKEVNSQRTQIMRLPNGKLQRVKERPIVNLKNNINSNGNTEQQHFAGVGRPVNQAQGYPG